MYDDFVFPIDFCFIIFLTNTNPVIKFFYHVGSFVVEIVDVGIFNRDSSCISLSYTVNNCVKICLIFIYVYFFLFLML